MRESQPGKVGFKSMAGYAAAKLIPGFLMLLAVPVWLQLFGPEEYGRYSIAWSLVAAVSSLLNGWIRQSVLRYSGQDKFAPENMPRWLIPTLCIVGSAALCATLTVLFSDVGFENLAWVLAATAAYLCTSTVNGIALVRAQRDGRSTRFAYAEISRLVAALVVSLLLSNVAVPGAAAVLFGYAVGSALASRLVRQPRATRRADPTTRQEVLRAFWSYGWPMSIWLFLSGTLVYIDRLIIATALGDDRAGNYAAVADLVIRGFGMATFPLTMATHPLVMKLWNSGEHAQALRTVRRYAAWLGGYTLVGVALVVIIGPSILGLILGTPPIDRLTVGFLAVGASLWQVALMAHKPLELSRRTGTMVLLLLLALTCSIVTSVSLIGAIGEAATAVGLSVGAATYIGGVLVQGRKVRSPHPVQMDGTR